VYRTAEEMPNAAAVRSNSTKWRRGLVKYAMGGANLVLGRNFLSFALQFTLANVSVR